MKSTGELLFSPYLNELRALISAGKSYEDYEGYLRFTDLTTGYTYSGISVPPVKSKGQWVDFFLQGDGIDCGFCPTAGRSYSVEVAIVEKATGTAVVKGVCEMTAAEAFSSSKYYNPTALPSGSIRPGGKLWVNYLTSGGGSVSGAVNQFVKEGETCTDRHGGAARGLSFPWLERRGAYRPTNGQQSGGGSDGQSLLRSGGGKNRNRQYVYLYRNRRAGVE